MAKQSGLGDNLYIGGYDLSGDIGSLGSISCPMSPLVVTDITQSGMARLSGGRDGSLEFTSFFDPAANMSHDRLKALPRTDQVLTYCRGTTLGKPSACMVAKQLNYDGSRGEDGAFTFEVSAQANGYGLEWGIQLTAGKRTDTGGAAGTPVDFGASSTNGLQAYLQVFAFTGTSVGVAIEESSDNALDAYVAVVGGAFTAATGITTQRIATAAGLTVERYLRVTTSGVFTNAVFSVVVIRNETAVKF